MEKICTKNNSSRADSLASFLDEEPSLRLTNFRNHRQRISYLLESINGRDYCLTYKINPNQLLTLLKINLFQLSIILQVNSSTQLQPIRSFSGVL